jgi:uncharacterized protein YmfQ (DUF2313 family)
MSRDPETVLDYLLSLSPAGEAMLLQDRDSQWAKWQKPLAAEISRFEGLADAMLAEANPGEAQYLLPDYQRVLGPDPYGRDSVALTLSDQQALALSRWTQRWGVRPADFVAFAASFGVLITITEYTVLTAPFFANDFLTNNPTQFTWVVHMPAAVVEKLTAPFFAGAYVGEFAPSLVQPAIAGRAPAHTNPVFSYV